MYQLQVEMDFAAAHNLRGYKGKCENLHGHNYRVMVEISGRQLNETGMLADFKDIKQMCRDIIGRLDHEYLNDTEPFDSLNPTTEHLAGHICQRLQEKMPDGLWVSAVTCWESPRCAARYLPD